MSWSTYKARQARARDLDARVWRDEVAPLLVSIASSALKAHDGGNGDFESLESWLDDIETEVASLRTTMAERDHALSGTGEG